MILTDEMYLIGTSSDKLCTYLDKDYVLLKKSMPVPDSGLEGYISNINKAFESGVKISRVLDYRFIPNTTSSYSNGNSYTKGVFLEERAKGEYVDRESIVVSLKNDYDFNSIVITYLNKFIKYMNSLEKRALAPQAVFDKLVWDCKKIEEFGLQVDPKPLNFFYDESNGFSIIDVIPSSDKTDEYSLATYIYVIVFGYGPTTLQIEHELYLGLPKEIKEKHAKILSLLNQKIQIALFNNGFNKAVVDDVEDKQSFRYQDRYKEVDMVQMVAEIEDIYTEKKKPREPMSLDELNMTFL